MKRKIAGEEHLVRRKGSSEWQLRFTIEGRRVRESTGTSDKVLAAAHAVQRHAALYRSMTLGQTDPLRMVWGEAAKRFLFEVAKHTANGQRHQTHVLTVLTRIVGTDTPLSDLTDDRVAELVERMRAPRPRIGGKPEVLSPASVNRYVALLGVVCARARDVWKSAVGAWSPAKHRLQEPIGRETFLDKDQARRLMGEACGHLRPILLLELTTGLRMRNALALQWENVSLDLGRALLIQKGGRRLRVELPAITVAMLEELEPEPVQRRGSVFTFGNPRSPCSCPHCVSPQYRGEPIRDIRRAFGGAARRAGVLWNGQTRLRFHDLRHTVASWALAETGNLQLVREMLGHANISTTQRYAHLLPGARASAAEAIAAGLQMPAAPRRTG